jgi:hypothetical protein
MIVRRRAWLDAVPASGQGVSRGGPVLAIYRWIGGRSGKGFDPTCSALGNVGSGPSFGSMLAVVGYEGAGRGPGRCDSCICVRLRIVMEIGMMDDDVYIPLVKKVERAETCVKNVVACRGRPFDRQLYWGPPGVW